MTGILIENPIVAETLACKGTASPISTYTVPAGKRVLITLIMTHTSNSARLRNVWLNGVMIDRNVTTANLRYIIARQLLLVAGDSITTQADYNDTSTFGTLFIRGFEV